MISRELFNKLPESYINEYWVTVMERRMDEKCELNRLHMILVGQWKMSDEECSLEDFLDSDRPFGNKDIPASIAYVLGWDINRFLCHMAVPDFVVKEAESLVAELEDYIYDYQKTHGRSY
jgi:hypothetical protein